MEGGDGLVRWPLHSHTLGICLFSPFTSHPVALAAPSLPSLHEAGYYYSHLPLHLPAPLHLRTHLVTLFRPTVL